MIILIIVDKHATKKNIQLSNILLRKTYRPSLVQHTVRKTNLNDS